MRKVTFGAAVSLDGFITGADGQMDWLHFSDDVQRHMAEYWPTVDAILMGRRTWEVAMASAGGGGGGGERDGSIGDDSAGVADGGTRTYVFSRTLTGPLRGGAELVSSDAAGFVRALKAKPGKDICLMGGGVLGRALLEAGVVDEVGLNIHPVLLGRGTPFFLDSGRIALELIENRTLAGGCILATYRVRGA